MQGDQRDVARENHFIELANILNMSDVGLQMVNSARNCQRKQMRVNGGSVRDENEEGELDQVVKDTSS